MRRRRTLFRWVSVWLLFSMLGVGLLGGAGLSVRAAPRQANALDVIINEIAWGGTAASTSDEWIELYNPGGSTISLDGWTLVAIDGTPSINLSGTIPAGGYYLLERTDDNTVSDVDANLIYTGALGNNPGAETLELRDDSNNLIDTANMGGTGWFAGTAAPDYYSMERVGVIADGPTSWANNDGVTRNGLDANGNPINGTPKQPNSAHSLYTPGMLLINEVAWMGTLASSDDEWMELYNPGASSIDLQNWRLVADDGSPDIVLNGTISAGGYFLLERAYDNVVTDVTADQIYFGELEDSDEILRLRAPDGAIVDTANSDGGAWPAGTISPNGSMERMGTITDAPLAWVTNVNAASWTHTDASGQLIHGTPGDANWGLNVTHTPIPTSTFTPSPTATPAPTAPLTVVISEVAWAGTKSSSDDEWIELYNPGTKDVNLTNWNLRSSDGSPNIKAEFNGIILGAGDYLLLERTDDDDVADVTADVIYTGSLSNSGEILRLYDPNGYLVDTANSNGGAWPAGIASTFSSMQRSLIATDSNYTWVTYDASKDTATTKDKDASGNDINGTPRRANTPFNVTPTPTPRSSSSSGSSSSGSSGEVVLTPVLGISEFLPRPGHDWNNDGVVDVLDEFIEIINAGQIDVNLSAYRLDDEVNLGSSPYTLPNLTLKPGERAVFYGAETGIHLSDAGDTVRLLKGSTTVIDAYTYGVVAYPDQSWCRLPDRMGYWNHPCFPTPNNPNALTGTAPLPPGGPTGYRPPVCLLPDNTPEEFVYAECEAGGAGIWSRQYWDEADASKQLKLDEPQKWETIFK